uniref:Secreted protein n=1 Tax=Cacopsylla melanoneura TaxID=428564 RepID=A0A8D9AHW4_9HEMI
MVSKALSFQVTLALTAIILTSSVCCQSTTVKTWPLKYDTRTGSFPTVDLCVPGKPQSCNNMKLDQATAVCGKSYNNYNFNKIAEAKCKEGTCLARIHTTDKFWIADLECKQAGRDPDATCTCTVFLLSEVEPPSELPG